MNSQPVTHSKPLLAPIFTGKPVNFNVNCPSNSKQKTVDVSNLLLKIIGAFSWLKQNRADQRVKYETKIQQISRKGGGGGVGFHNAVISKRFHLFNSL